MPSIHPAAATTTDAPPRHAELRAACRRLPAIELAAAESFRTGHEAVAPAHLMGMRHGAGLQACRGNAKSAAFDGYVRRRSRFGACSARSVGHRHHAGPGKTYDNGGG